MMVLIVRAKSVENTWSWTFFLVLGCINILSNNFNQKTDGWLSFSCEIQLCFTANWQFCSHFHTSIGYRCQEMKWNTWVAEKMSVYGWCLIHLIQINEKDPGQREVKVCVITKSPHVKKNKKNWINEMNKLFAHFYEGID